MEKTSLRFSDFVPQKQSEFLQLLFEANEVVVKSNDYRTTLPIDKYHLINMVQNMDVNVFDFRIRFNVSIDLFSNGKMWITFINN